MPKVKLFDKDELDERYVTKDYCENKKGKYVLKEICEVRIKSVEETNKEIQDELREINRKMDNHITHMSEYIGKIYTKLAVISTNSGGMDKKLIIQLAGVITTLVTVLSYLLYYFSKGML